MMSFPYLRTGWMGSWSTDSSAVASGSKATS